MNGDKAVSGFQIKVPERHACTGTYDVHSQRVRRMLVVFFVRYSKDSLNGWRGIPHSHVFDFSFLLPDILMAEYFYESPDTAADRVVITNC
jgi:hypothetical protein